MYQPEPMVVSDPAPILERAAPDKYCIFRSGSVWFSVPAACVREVALAPALVGVPHGHPILPGLCYLHSELLPVLSLVDLLAIDVSGPPQRDDQLLAIDGPSPWALLTAEIALEPLAAIVAPKFTVEETQQIAVTGTAMHGKELVRVLDPDRLLRLAQQVLDDAWRARGQSMNRSQWIQGSTA